MHFTYVHTYGKFVQLCVFPLYRRFTVYLKKYSLRAHRARLVTLNIHQLWFNLFLFHLFWQMLISSSWYHFVCVVMYVYGYVYTGYFNNTCYHRYRFFFSTWNLINSRASCRGSMKYKYFFFKIFRKYKWIYVLLFPKLKRYHQFIYCSFLLYSKKHIYSKKK